MHTENELATYSQKAEEKDMDIKQEKKNQRPMQTDKKSHAGVSEEPKKHGENEQ